MDIQDPPEGHVTIGEPGDVVRVRAAAYVQSAQQGDSAATVVHDLAAVGAIPRTVLADVWLKVTAVVDRDTHFRYTVQRISPSSADQVRFPVDTLVINYGPVDNRLLQLRATRERTPQVEVFTPGDSPWQKTSAQVRLGRLDDLAAITGEQYGLAAGANLNAAGSPHARISQQGAHLSQLGLSLDDGSKTTVQIDSSGALKLGADVTAPDSVDLGYDPATKTVRIRKLQADDATVDGALAVKGALSGDGDARFGAQADGGALFDLKSGEGTLAIAAVTTFQGGVILQDALTIQGDATMEGALTVKGALSGDGDVRFGAQADGGALFDLKSGESALAIAAVTTFQGDVTLQDALTVQGAASFAGDATMGGQTLLQGPTTAHKPVTLLEEGALVVGETESVRVDKEGITMRLQPGEHNAVKVLGIGRAALLNAYQTAQSVQQFDMLGYYSAGVPSLHGRVMIGVANVAGGEPDLLLRMTRYFTGVRRMDIRASLLDVKSDSIQLTGDVSVNGSFEFSGTGSPDRIFRLRNLPVRPDGLPTGAVWNDRGTLKIVL
jgi:cytoskeletal protein CcmA (bactofilin family)